MLLWRTVRSCSKNKPKIDFHVMSSKGLHMIVLHFYSPRSFCVLFCILFFFLQRADCILKCAWCHVTNTEVSFFFIVVDYKGCQFLWSSITWYAGNCRLLGSGLHFVCKKVSHVMKRLILIGCMLEFKVFQFFCKTLIKYITYIHH